MKEEQGLQDTSLVCCIPDCFGLPVLMVCTLRYLNYVPNKVILIEPTRRHGS